jgi:hypothetical protein
MKKSACYWRRHCRLGVTDAQLSRFGFPDASAFILRHGAIILRHGADVRAEDKPGHVYVSEHAAGFVCFSGHGSGDDGAANRSDDVGGPARSDDGRPLAASSAVRIFNNVAYCMRMAPSGLSARCTLRCCRFSRQPRSRRRGSQNPCQLPCRRPAMRRASRCARYRRSFGARTGKCRLTGCLRNFSMAGSFVPPQRARVIDERQSPLVPPLPPPLTNLTRHTRPEDPAEYGTDPQRTNGVRLYGGLAQAPNRVGDALSAIRTQIAELERRDAKRDAEIKGALGQILKKLAAVPTARTRKTARRVGKSQPGQSTPICRAWSTRCRQGRLGPKGSSQSRNGSRLR